MLNWFIAVKAIIQLIWDMYKWTKELKRKKSLATILLAIFLVGCAGLETQNTATKKPLYNYKADMEIEVVGGPKFDGMAVAKLDGPKTFRIISMAKLDVLVVSSCQRYDKFERVNKGWFGGSGKTFTYQYIPSPTEKDRACPLYFQAFDKSGLTDWGYVAFKRDQELPANSECSGLVKRFNGHSICQVKSGFEQAISFDEPVNYFDPDDNCNMKRKSDRAFTYRPALGFCTAEFSNGKLFHSLTALAFDEVFVRGE